MNQSVHKNDSLEVEQTLVVNSASLRVHRTELTKNDYGSFILIAEVSEDAAIINGLLDKPSSACGQKLRCRYDGVEATATLDMFTNLELALPHDRQILHFACADLEANEVNGEFYEFLLPYANFGIGDHFTRVETGGGGTIHNLDHIQFMIEGTEWTLRHLIDIDGILYLADEAIQVQQHAGVKNINLKASAHVALQVQTCDVKRAVAEAQATDICWLLNLAYAQQVSWAELRIRSGRNASFLCHRSLDLPKRASGSRPLRNWRNGLIKKYIEAAYEVFKTDPEWWRETLNWYSIACEHSIVESSGMILSVMLDRLSSRLLRNVQHPKQIGEDLAVVLEDSVRKKELCESIQHVMEGFSTGWDKARTNALVGKIKEWNDQPSYVRKIEIAFNKVGLREPSRDLLKKRHKLAHEGSIDIAPKEAVDFYLDLNRQVLILLFAMLDYRGKFSSLGRGESQVTDFAIAEPSSPISTPGPNP